MNDCVNKYGQKTCCVCLNEGEYILWESKVNVNDEQTEQDAAQQLKVYIRELFTVFTGSEEFLYNMEFEYVCRHCLQQLRQSFILYQKIKKNYERYKSWVDSNLAPPATDKAKENDDTAEYILETDEQADQLDDTTQHEIEEYIDSSSTEHNVIEIINAELVTQSKKFKSELSTNRRAIHAPPKQNSSLIISQFLPATTLNISIPEEADDNDVGSDVRTLEYAALSVEGSNLNQLAELHQMDAPSNDTIYVCKYCPQAFSSPPFLINHVRKNHVCKFCTASFRKCTDLFDHIRKEHREHKCVICSKRLSSHSNLRAHIKRIHGVKLPPHVALLDYQLPSNEVNANLPANEKCAEQEFVTLPTNCAIDEFSEET